MRQRRLRLRIKSVARPLSVSVSVRLEKGVEYMGIVTWRGVRTDERTATMAEAAAKLTSASFVVSPSQGSYSGSVAASGNTHVGGGALDIKAVNLTTSQRKEVVRCYRRVGFAMWLRTPSQSNWPFHCHGIAIQPGGYGDIGVLSSAAHSQVKDYYNGINGLAGRGRDDGPRDYVGVVWEFYINPNPSVNLNNLKYGKNNSDVKDLQRALNVYLPPHTLYVDGIYGPATDDAVRNHQRIHHLGSDPARRSFVGTRQAEKLGLRPTTA